MYIYKVVAKKEEYEGYRRHTVEFTDAAHDIRYHDQNWKAIVKGVDPEETGDLVVFGIRFTAAVVQFISKAELDESMVIETKEVVEKFLDKRSKGTVYSGSGDGRLHDIPAVDIMNVLQVTEGGAIVEDS